MKLIERDTFYVCGYAVETTAEQNDDDVSRLYRDFFDHDKETALRCLHGSKKGYLGLSWYSQGHEKYCYLLGVEIGEGNEPPPNAFIRTLEKTMFAVACYPHNKDIKEAWNEFFYSDIPIEGYAPNEEYNLYFEYYPKDVHGDYELWVPVVKTNV